MNFDVFWCKMKLKSCLFRFLRSLPCSLSSGAGLGFRQFGRFEGLTKMDQQKCTEVYRKYADLGHDIQVGYGHFGGK